MNMLMVFGVKSDDDSNDTSIAGKLDPRLLKRNTMTTFQMKMQLKFDEQKNMNKSTTIDGFDGVFMNKSDNQMINSYDDATAKIANAVEIRDMKTDRSYL